MVLGVVIAHGILLVCLVICAGCGWVSCVKMVGCLLGSCCSNRLLWLLLV